MSLRKLRSVQRLVVWTAMMTIVFPPPWIFAAEQADDAQTLAAMGRALGVIDVAIDQDGVLRGQVVDKQGQPLVRQEFFLGNEQVERRVQTDRQGRFQMTGLSGATYQAQVGEQIQLMRVWSAGSCRPSASQGLLFVQDGDVVLAQHCGSPLCGSTVANRHPLANPWIFGGLVAAAIAIPVAIHNRDSDDPPADP